MLMAFLDGRRSCSLHEAESMEPLLDLGLPDAKAKLGSSGDSCRGWAGYGRFALLVLESSLVLTLPVAAAGGAAVGLFAVMRL